MSTEDPREISSSRVFDAPRDLVFRMWTDPKHIAQWWGPNGFTNTIRTMDVRPGGVWEFVMHGPDGRDYLNRIVYVEVVEPERIVYDHVTGPLFRATATFEDENGKTRLTLRAIFETAELRNRVAEEFGAVEGMHQTLDRLGEHLPTITDDDEFVITRSFDAPRELMWKVWTELDHMKHWFGPKGTNIVSSNLDFRPGGIYHYAMGTPDGGKMWGRWVFREIVPPERLVFVSAFSNENAEVAPAPFPIDWPSETLSTITFEERGGKTTVTVRWKALTATEAQKKTFFTSHASMRGGWTGTFDQLEAYLKEVQL